MSLQVGVIGACGRMGKSIIRCLLEGRVDGLVLAAAIDVASHPDQGKDAGEAAGSRHAGVKVSADLTQALQSGAVFIDFSSHEATTAHVLAAAEAGCAMVIGTTGFSDAEKTLIANAAKKIPVVLAPNMSLGVNLLFNLAEQAARALSGKGYDVEIVETHHRRKKDAPSGTALGIGEAVARGLDWPLGEVAAHGREGLVGERPNREIGFHAVRGGDVIGDHTVMFAAEGEIIELSHRATSRDTFAVGALRAAAWLGGRKPGLFSMKDVLGL